MLRRRIFSSAMASVMALSSIAVVANAEETVNQYKTADDLKELVEKKYGADWRADELPAYGSIATEKITDAIEAAEEILDRGGDSKDYTYAYFMVESVVAEYEIKTNEDLKKLVADCKPTYTKGNVYNEELNDLIYFEDTWAAFEEAYLDAEATIGSEFPADITDAWYALNGATLKKYDTVTKAKFRAALKNYEQIIQNAIDYDYWSLGKLADVKGSLKNIDKANPWGGFYGSTIPYGVLIDRLLVINEPINDCYNKLDAIKGLTETSDKQYVEAYQALLDAYTIYKGWTADSIGKGTKSAVKNLLKDYNSKIVFEDAALRASAEEILADVADVTAETPIKDPKTKVETTTINNLYVVKGGAKVELTEEMLDADALADGAWDITMGELLVDGWIHASRIDSVGLAIVPKKTTYIPIKDGVYDNTRDVVVSDVAPEGYTSTSYQRIGAGVKFDLTKLVAIDYSDINLENPMGCAYDTINVKGVYLSNYQNHVETFGDPILDVSIGLLGGTDSAKSIYNPEMAVYKSWVDDGTGAYVETTDGAMFYGVDLEYAIDLANTYLTFDSKNGDKSQESKIFKMFDAIDTSNVLSPNATEIKYNGNEWTTVYRYLYYALTQRYDTTPVAAAATYDRRDVEKLIEDCHVLAEKVGDTAIFAASHGEMVEMRQEAREWLRQANSDKYYKKDSGYDFLGEENINATKVYETLKGKYDQVAKEEAALSITFGEIYDKLAQTAADIDADKLTNSASLQKAMLNVANALYKLDPVTYTTEWAEYYENEAFDEELNIIAINRLITHTDTANPVEIKTISNELSTADKTVTAKIVADAWGVNSTHKALLDAYNALKFAIAEQAAPATAKGDVDNDGTAYTVKDALAALKIANKLQDLTVDIEVADHNDNDTVDVSDALTILKKANGLA